MTKAFWIIVVVGILAMLQVKFFQKMSFKKLSYKRTISKTTVFEGEKLDLVEVISNNKLLPIPWIRIESRLSPWLRFKSSGNLSIVDDQYHRSIFYLKSFSRVTRRYEVHCIHRGFYDLSDTTVTIGDLFGMSFFMRELNHNIKLWVYPAILDDSQLPDEALRWQGDISVRRWIFPDPILINGIRDYKPGDSRKDIHWKATARTGNLQVKTHDYTVCPRIVLVFNVDPQDLFWGHLSAAEQEDMEYGIRVAASIIAWAIENDMEVGLYSNARLATDRDGDIAIAPACSETQFHLLLTALAAVELKEHESIYHTMERLLDDQTEDADILVLSTFWNDSLEERSEALRALGNSVTHVYMRKEAVKFEYDETEGDAPARAV